MSTTDGTTDGEQKTYADTEDVPLGSFDYPDTDVTKAIRRASARLEADVNDGAEIETPGDLHSDAVENLATYRLLRPSTGPSEARYSDTAEYGDAQLDYLNTYKAEYDEIVESINSSDPDETEGGDDITEGEGIYQPEPQFESY